MIIIGLGSNVGDRLNHLDNALDAIERYGKVIATSSLYESPALLPDDAPESWNIPFINMCAEIECDLDPDEFIKVIRNIESDLGRDGSHERWSPRTIDIDILAWNEQVETSSTLTLPHPDMHKRDFVLLPLLDIAPKWLYPTGDMKGMTPKELLEKFCDSSNAKKFEAGNSNS